MNNYSKLAIGSLLLRPKCLGIIQHEGVLVGYDTVLHNTPEKGEHISSIQEFAAGHRIKVQPTAVEPSFITVRARQVLMSPRVYDLLARNCQHTTSEIIRGIAKSPWVISGAIALGLIVGIWIISLLLRRLS